MRKLALAGLVLVATITTGGIVAAPYALAADTGPGTTACLDAKAQLVLAVKATLDLNPNVFPGGVLPSADAVTPALLTLVLADPDLGAGGQVVVRAALAAAAKVDTACADPTGTATPTPTATATPTPTGTASPTTTSRPRTTVVVPRGGINTGRGL